MKICKVDQPTCIASLFKQGYFLYLCTPVHHLPPQLTVCDFQVASGGNELTECLVTCFKGFARIMPYAKRIKMDLRHYRMLVPIF